MGLFSSGKNKQDRVLEDSGRFYSKDDDAALGERARAKRATNAGGAGATARRSANDPLLPEKKRARRRLVGAIALALAAAVGLPMLLDSEPKPLAGDIAIQIPSKDKAAPLPVPGDKAVSAEDSVDKGEEVIAAPEKAAPVARTEPAPEPAPVAKADSKAESKAESKADTAKPAEHKSRDQDDAHLAAEKARAERLEKEKQEKQDRLDRLARAKAEEKERAAERAAEKAAEKAAAEKAAKAHDDARALAILEDKSADKAAEKARSESAAQKFVLQVAALSSQEKAAEVQAKLREAGIASYTQKATTASGELIRVRVGPLSREEAEKVKAKLGKLGLSGTMTPV